MMDLTQMRISALRAAIQSNQVSFPSQTPCFNQSRADIQWRLVQLYFVRGWNCIQLGRRYNLTRQRIEQLLAEWVHSACTLGYLQEIPSLVENDDGWQRGLAVTSECRPIAAGAGADFATVGYPDPGYVGSLLPKTMSGAHRTPRRPVVSKQEEVMHMLDIHCGPQKEVAGHVQTRRHAHVLQEVG